jgi:hypothetical protein
MALARLRGRRLENAAHQLPLELLGLIVKHLARHAERREVPGAEATVDPEAEQRVLAQGGDHQRPQLLQEMPQRAPLSDVAFTVHGVLPCLQWRINRMLRLPGDFDNRQYP